jgi:hypothetical protein
MKWVFFCALIFCLGAPLWALSENEPFRIGEQLRYSIYALGIKVGYQTLEFSAAGELNGSEVYILKGLSKSAGFLSIFYRLNDNWSIFMEKDSFLPLRVEKDWQEGQDEGYYRYEIDQQSRKVTLYNVSGGTVKSIDSKNSVFDLFSLVYYYRRNTEAFDDVFTFDFLEARSVQTVRFQNEGTVRVTVPRISERRSIRARKLQQIGGVGIEIYMAEDNLKLPLKIVAPSKLPRGKVLDIIFYLDRYYPGEGTSIRDIPRVYISIMR